MGAPALAGGSAEHTLLIIDPTNADSMYIGNYYKHARGIPDANVVYMAPGAIDYPAFVATNQPALLGTMAHRQLTDHIDQIVIAATDVFYIDAPGLVADGCVPVRRFSITGAYSIMPISSDVLAGVQSSQRNGYYQNSQTPRAFSAQSGWSGGVPSSSGDKSYLVASLGYLGERGNTTSEILDLIDRSVLADGSFPAGTFYFMQTNDSDRSGPRHGAYPGTVADIIALGGQAQHITGQVLPGGSHDCLGIMTGAASPNIDGSDITIIPGAFCDHLTSWAATFDKSQQVKVSRWIVKGASGSWGQVEEPCNYAGKFPIANIHTNYFQGLSLGEAIFRSVSFVPFQGLLYGDPLTQPFTHIPVVDMPDLPAMADGTGPLFLAYTGSTTHPTAGVSSFELIVDGDKLADVFSPFPLVLPAHLLTTGWHEVRLLGKDNTNIKAAGSFVGAIEIVRPDTSLALAAAGPTAGDLDTAYSFTLDATGDDIVEVRLISNARVLDASARCGATMAVFGSTLGAGAVRVQGEALHADGSITRSAPIELDIAFASSAPTGTPPRAVSYTKRVLGDDPILVELPAISDEDPASLSFTLLSGPAHATATLGSGGFVFLTPNAGAIGTDTLTYRVDGPAGSSNIATVTILYTGYDLDLNGDGVVGVDDLYTLHTNPTDVNGDGVADNADRRFLERVIRCDEMGSLNAQRR